MGWMGSLGFGITLPWQSNRGCVSVITCVFEIPNCRLAILVLPREFCFDFMAASRGCNN